MKNTVDIYLRKNIILAGTKNHEQIYFYVRPGSQTVSN